MDKLMKKTAQLANNKRACWEAKQYKKGWRVGLCVGNAKAIWLDVWFKSAIDVNKALRQTGIVYVEMANKRK